MISIILINVIFSLLKRLLLHLLFNAFLTACSHWSALQKTNLCLAADNALLVHSFASVLAALSFPANYTFITTNNQAGLMNLEGLKVIWVL